MVQPRIEQALEAVDGFSTTDAIRHLSEGGWNLWMVYSKAKGCEAVVIGEVCQYPRSREYHIRICLGDEPRRWVHLRANIEAYARRVGCRTIKMLAGRDGWIKMLPDYEATHVLLAKVL